jgi:hypothetical protein
MDINYSDGSVVKDAVIQIWEDNHTERSGYFRAFWCASAEATTGSPVIGYCSPGGSHRTIRATVGEAKRYAPAGTKFYRNGREVANA